MEISVIIPVFNGENIIGESVELIRKFLESHFDSYEIIVINDGSTDNTLGILESLPDRNLRILSLERNTGKYAALAVGMKTGCGSCRVFTDADLPYDLEALPCMAKLINGGQVQIVIGDRTLRESRHLVRPPLIRNMATKTFTFLIALLVTGSLFDTQCGLKGFRSDVAEALFPLLQENGFAGDVELLFIALRYNLDIRRIPVYLKRKGPSTVHLFPHALGMLRRVLMLRHDWKHGCYHSKLLNQISSQA